ncbi:MAG: aldo/keto reductase [Phycisphaerales bacterium]|nr:aldo/keto reductase [Phycisphaerales bacterium]
MGACNLPLTPIGYGAFKIGRNQATKYASAYDLPDDATVDRLLNTVLELGVRYIDTAPAYGSSEERIGRAIGHRRSEFHLSTKVGETFENGRSTYDFSAAFVRTGVERSLRRLRTEVIDLVLVHASRNDLDVITRTDVVPTLQALRDEGAVRCIGLSGYTTGAFENALTWADAIMVEYHAEYRALEPVIAAASANGLAVIVKKPLASGRLDASPALSLVLSNPGVTSAVVGGLNLDHLRDNVAVANAVRPGVPMRQGG